jgi:hypothetical protein
MRAAIVAAVAALSVAPLVAQEAKDTKPVPKDSMRVYVAGCTKGMVFTAGPRTEDPPSSLEIREGMHLRMNGPKKLMGEIKAHEGSMIGITGLMKKGQYSPGGIPVGGGVRIGPAPSGPGAGAVGNPYVEQAFIDVETWRQVPGNCPSR